MRCIRLELIDSLGAKYVLENPMGSCLFDYGPIKESCQAVRAELVNRNQEVCCNLQA